MNNRDSFLTSTQKALIKLTEGTVIGLTCRYLTWPLEKIVYDASTSQSPGYLQFFKNNLKRDSLKELHSVFKKAGIGQTIGKAASSMGVVTVVDHNYNHLSAGKKGLLTAAIGFIPEAITTVSGEIKRVQLYQNMQNRATPVQQVKHLTPAFYRMLYATSAKALWTSITTFTAINKTDELLRPHIPAEYQHSVFIKVGAALSSTFLIQPFNMPVINMHTYVLRNHDQSLAQAAKSFYHDNKFPDYFRGSLGRSVHRSLFYGISFFMSECIKKADQKSPPADLQIKPKLTRP